MKVRCDITQGYIRKGGHSCCTCPGALAVNEWLTSLYFSDIGLEECYIYSKNDFLVSSRSWLYKFDPPQELVDFINVYDFNRLSAIPTTFVVDLPEEFLDVGKVVCAKAGT